MKNILLFFLFVVGVVNHGEGKNVRLHGSLKEFGKSVVIMDFDGAVGDVSKARSQKIVVNEDGSFDFSFDLNYTIDDQLFLTQDQGLSDEVYRMLKGLTGRQKEIIYLRFIHEMSFDEISEIMEINIQSARNLLARSMEKLRKEAILAIILFFI